MKPLKKPSKPPAFGSLEWEMAVEDKYTRQLIRERAAKRKAKAKPEPKKA